MREGATSDANVVLTLARCLRRGPEATLVFLGSDVYRAGMASVLSPRAGPANALGGAVGASAAPLGHVVQEAPLLAGVAPAPHRVGTGNDKHLVFHLPVALLAQGLLLGVGSFLGIGLGT